MGRIRPLSGRRGPVSVSVITALFLVLAACGDDVGSTTTKLVTTSTTGVSMEDTEAQPDESVAHEAMADETMSDEDLDHEHEGDTTREWDGGPVPTLEATVKGDVESGWDVIVTISDGFTFGSASTVDHVPGEGHGHIYVDGRLLQMIFEPQVHISSLELGTRRIKVTLSANDHVDYVVGGEPLGAAISVDVAGEVDPADVLLEVMYLDGEVVAPTDRAKVSLGGIVEIVVTSDVDEEVHVHGYDIMRGATPTDPAVLRFTADIPGIFEVELETSGRFLFELEVS